jgi:hypothetical protein
MTNDAEEEYEPQNRDMSFWATYSNIYYLYERRTMALIALQYINEAGSIVLQISCTLYFIKCHVEPVTATWYMCIISLPEALMVFYGAFVENVSIFGKRGHIVLGALLQTFFSIAIFSKWYSSLAEYIACATLVNCGKAWMFPAIESLSVI